MTDTIKWFLVCCFVAVSVWFGYSLYIWVDTMVDAILVLFDSIEVNREFMLKLADILVESGIAERTYDNAP